MIVILFCWLALVVIGVSRKKVNERSIGSEQALALRGVCAIEIMIGHIGLATGSIVLYPNRKAGILFVGIFFMLSGYGLRYSVDNKPEYLKHFFVKRIMKLLIPAYLAYVVYILIRWLALSSANGWALLDLSDFARTLNWYVWEQLFFYLVFWFAYRFIPGLAEGFIGIISIGFIIVAFMLKLDNPWYGSTMCFLLGMCYYKYEMGEHKLSNNKQCLLFGMFGMIVIFSMAAFYILGNESALGNPIARNVASVCFCIMVLIILKEMKIGNSISKFLGTCSYEIFLVHPFVQGMLQGIIEYSALLYAILVITLSVGVASVIHQVVTLIEKSKTISIGNRGH